MKRLLTLMAMMLALVSTMMAQITTSALSGKVTMQDTKEEVIGASVQVVHDQSGMKYATVTNIDGRFSIQGMRNGGPYTVTVSYIGYETKTFKEIYLDLGETYNLQVWLSENSNELTEVVVSGKASKFTAEKTGASTNVNNATIRELPTINRSITDIARLSPYANGMGFSGGDGRSTNFTLDGANMNNNFGLSSNLPGGGTPISMEALDEVQMVVAPYDVRQSNFIGGGINAVTKSGTNTFRGTAYMYYNNENMRGNRIDNKELAAREQDRLTTYGFTLGGPILKDKLFFFVNYEGSKKPTTVNRWRGSEDGVGDRQQYISRTKLSDLERTRQFLLKNYNYDPGSYTDFPADITNNKFLARIDWNIARNHRLAVRFNHTINKTWNNPNGSSADVGYRLNGTYRMGEQSMAFSNSLYSMDNKITTVSADLNSRFSDKLSNQFLFTYSDIQDVRGSDSSLFPFVDIMYDYDAQTKTQTLEPYMSFGYELFTYNNKVQNKVTTVTDNVTYYAGAHKLMAGISFEHQLALNNYQRGGTGYYRYRTLDDFLSGAAPESVALQYGYNGNTNPGSSITFNQLGLYLQDEWDVLNNLKVQAGIRFDDLVFDNSDIMRNNAIYGLDFGGRHVDTGAWPKNNIQISPRVGFSWDVFGDKSLKVRGGSGFFAGRIPLVFFTNMPQNSGMIQNLITATTTYKNGVVNTVDPRLANFAGGLVTDVDKIRELLGGPVNFTSEDGVVSGDFAGVDNKFKMPQDWKSSIAIDYQVPVSFPLTVTGEFTYSKRINDIMLDNYNIKPIDESWQRLSGADNRYVYPSDYKYNPTYTTADGTTKQFTGMAAVLTNTSRGYGWTANITVNAEPVKNLRLMAAYTHTVNKRVSGMPGSNASSAWTSLYTINGPNFPSVQTVSTVIPDRFVANASYKYGKEHFSVFYEGYRSGGYSFYYGSDINGDNVGYDLMYIPRDDSEIKFASDDDRIAFWDFVEQDDYLKNHKGEYAEAFSAHGPWVHKIDFRWAHDFDLKVGSTQHKLQLSLDIQNIGNLFNSKFGVEKVMTVNSCNSGKILSVKEIKDGVPVFKCNVPQGASTYEFSNSNGQCWRMQVGVKYFFN
ncbi:MAG: TonB-dependent receptor [Prevotella sp.]|nr:TonB-dependent receptor [Prevotella sp.]